MNKIEFIIFFRYDALHWYRDSHRVFFGNVLGVYNAILAKYINPHYNKVVLMLPGTYLPEAQIQ